MPDLRKVAWLKARASHLKRIRGNLLAAPFAVLRGVQRVTGLTSRQFGPPRGFSTSEAEAARPGSGVVRKQIYPAGTIERRPPVSADDPGAEFLIRRLTTGMRESVVCEVTEGRCLSSAGWVLTQEDRLLADLSIDLGAGDARSHAASFLLRCPPCRRLESPVALLSAAGGDNYFHWMMEALPRLALLIEAGWTADRLPPVLVASKKPFRMETLRAAGIREDQVLGLDEYPHVEAPLILAATIPGINGNPPKWIVDFLQSLFPPEAGETRQGRLYVVRDQGPRSIVNEAEVRQRLLALGFEAVRLEEMTVAEQARRFRTAEAIAAPHGAGLSNLAFCRPGVRVLEMFAPSYINPCFWTLANQVDAEYAHALGEGPITQSQSDNGAVIKMPPENLERALRRLGLA